MILKGFLFVGVFFLAFILDILSCMVENRFKTSNIYSLLITLHLKVCLPMAGGWDEMSFKVPSNLNNL